MLRSKGCKGARTIHSLIYRPREAEAESEDSSPTFVLNEDSAAARASLIIIDECSMVDEELGRDLLSFGKQVLVLGDPAQLPPVRGGGFFTDAEPDVMLTEVHRQAADNPIIRMSMTVREGGRLDRGAYGDSQVIPRADIDAAAATAKRPASRRPQPHAARLQQAHARIIRLRLRVSRARRQARVPQER